MSSVPASKKGLLGRARGWFVRAGCVLGCSANDLLTDNGLHWAAAVAYWGVLSILPLIIAAIGIASLFVNPEDVIERGTAIIGVYLPRGGQQELESIVRTAVAAGGAAGLVSIVTSLWTGSRVFDVATTALNIAYDVDEPYGFFKRNAIAIAMAGSLGVFFLLSVLSPLAIAAVGALVPFASGALVTGLSWSIPSVLMFTALLLVYRFVPRKRIGWRSASIGALVALLLLSLSRPVLTMYIVKFANYNVIYGSLAILVSLVFWAWIGSTILLYGGEVGAHAHHLVVERRSTEQIRERHLARTPMRRPEDTGGPSLPNSR